MLRHSADREIRILEKLLCGFHPPVVDLLGERPPEMPGHEAAEVAGAVAEGGRHAGYRGGSSPAKP
jgi:hypothetical protein